MAGLLDAITQFASSDEGMGLAQGLLSARGSQGLAAGVAGMQEAKANAMKRKFMEMQMANYQSEIDQRAQAIKKDAEKQDLIKSILGGGGSNFQAGQTALGNVAASGGQAGPTNQAASMIPQQQGGALSRMTPEHLALLKANGIDLTEPWKLANVPTSLPAGAYTQLAGKAPQFLPNPKDGFMLGADGSSQLMPGFANNTATLAAATESAKAGLDLVDVPMGDGTTQKMPRLQATKMLSGNGQQTAPSIPSVGQFQPTPQQMALIQQDARANGIQNPFANFTQQPGSSAFGRTQAPADVAVQKANEAKLIKTAEADVVRDTSTQADSKKYGQFVTAADTAIDLLKKGPTASGIGSAVDSAAGFFGKSTKGADVASQLDTVSGWMTANVPRMEGPQSDKDVMNYRIMAAAVGDKTKPISQRLAAAEQAKSLIQKYAGGGVSEPAKPAERTVIRSGMYGGKRVVQYSDGSTEYAN